MFKRPSSSGFSFLGSGKVSKANKRKRAGDREDVRAGNSKKELKLTPELRQWYESNTLYEEMAKRSLNVLKIVCEENGIKRSGAKYEVTAAIEAHCEGYYRQQERLQIISQSKGNSDDSISAAFKLEVLSIKSLETVDSYCKKFQIKKLDKEKDFNKKIEMLIGITSATKEQVHIAVTGSKRHKYNGKHGDLAEDLLDYLANDIWFNFIQTNQNILTLEQFEKCINSMAEKNGSEDYGHANVLARVGDQILDFIKDEFANYLSEKLDSIDQYGRRDRKRTIRVVQNNDETKSKVLKTDGSNDVSSISPPTIVKDTNPVISEMIVKDTTVKDTTTTSVKDTTTTATTTVKVITPPSTTSTTTASKSIRTAAFFKLFEKSVSNVENDTPAVNKKEADIIDLSSL